MIPIFYLGEIKAYRGAVTSLKSYIQLMVKAGFEPGQSNSTTLHLTTGYTHPLSSSWDLGWLEHMHCFKWQYLSGELEIRDAPESWGGPHSKHCFLKFS